VTAADVLDLSFRTGGQVAYAGPKVGTHVSAGTLLTRLSAADLEAQAEQAQAQLAAQKAQLATVIAGATPQSVAVAQTAVANAQSALTQAKQNLLQASQDAYIKSDDAIHNKIDQFFTNPRSSSPILGISSSNSQLTISVQSDRVAIEQTLVAWQSYLSSVSTSLDSIDAPAVETQTNAYLTQVRSYLDEVAVLLSSASPTGALSSSAIQTYQSNIATARTNISGAISQLNTSEVALQVAQSSLATANSQLALVQAPPTQNALAVAQAAVAAAQATVDLAQAQVGKTAINAPIGGTITVNNANIGETAAPGTVMISMISDSRFEVVTYVSESDVAKLKVGDAASVALDAYQGEASFSAHLTAVDPAATLTNGISSYKVTLEFDANDPHIQAGMTGSVHIITNMHENALSVPTSAIITQGTDTFVLVADASGDRKTSVRVGISSASGMTEVVSGLNATDRIRTFGQN
jgi:RND family efflux transporter MFP subunit